MALTDIEVKLDEDLLKQFTEICEENGISVNKACIMFAKYCVKNQYFPFDIYAYDDEARDVILATIYELRLAFLNDGRKSFTVEEVTELIDKFAMDRLHK